jgi:hypothetical protein
MHCGPSQLGKTVNHYETPRARGAHVQHLNDCADTPTNWVLSLESQIQPTSLEFEDTSTEPEIILARDRNDLDLLLTKLGPSRAAVIDPDTGALIQVLSWSDILESRAAQS